MEWPLGDRQCAVGAKTAAAAANKQIEKASEEAFKNGRGERIRTSDLTVPNRALYQAEPRPVK